MFFKLALRNVKKSIKDYSIYFLTLVFGVSIFYAFNSIARQDTVLKMSEMQTQMFKLLATLIGGVSVFVAVILGFLIVYANRFLIRRRKKEFGIYLTLGMSKQSVSKVLVFETLVVGLLSLAVGLFVGIVLSQALLYITAALFEVKITTFSFAFSQTAFLMTIASFFVIFFVALIFNVTSVSRTKIINLIYADRMNETMKLRNLGLSAVLFLVSLGCIITAYVLLLKNGLVLTNRFYASTALVCFGTGLFFYSLSGFLLQILQKNKKYYYRGLNAFSLRQLSAKVNTAFISITLVCLTLFLAITSTCTGFAVVTTMNKSLKSTTPFDASYRTYMPNTDNLKKSTPDYYKKAQADKYQMLKKMKHDIPAFDTYVKDAEQMTLYSTDIHYVDMFSPKDKEAIRVFSQRGMGKTHASLVKLSEFNELLKLQGKKPLKLSHDQIAVWSDFAQTLPVWKTYIKNNANSKLSIPGLPTMKLYTQLQTVPAQTIPFNGNFGTLIIPDASFPHNARVDEIHTNIVFNDAYKKSDTAWLAAVNKTYPKQDGWPFQQGMTAQEVYSQSTGLSTIVTYLALYIGFILLITCAAILSLQQLSESADNVLRYNLLSKIGAEQNMVDRALFAQMAIYFLFPALLATAHAIVALRVSTDVVKLLGHMDIAEPLVITVSLLLVIYGGYFLVTYFASRAMIKPRH